MKLWMILVFGLLFRTAQVTSFKVARSGQGNNQIGFALAGELPSPHEFYVSSARISLQ